MAETYVVTTASGAVVMAEVVGTDVAISQDGQPAAVGWLGPRGRIEGCDDVLGAGDGSESEAAYGALEAAIRRKAISYLELQADERNLSECRECARAILAAQVAALQELFPGARVGSALRLDASGSPTRYDILRGGEPSELNDAELEEIEYVVGRAVGDFEECDHERKPWR